MRKKRRGSKSRKRSRKKRKRREGETMSLVCDHRRLRNVISHDLPFGTGCMHL